jgi:hypothetical protein
MCASPPSNSYTLETFPSLFEVAFEIVEQKSASLIL